MTVNSIGDLALSFQLRHQNASLKTELDRLSGELSTGITDDISSRQSGNFSPLASIERGLSISDSFLVGVSERRLEASAIQNALGTLRSLGQISGALLTVQETGDPTLVRSAGNDANGRFEASLNILNSQVGGRSIFSGTQTDQPSVADAETILAALESAVALAGADTADTITDIVVDWFSPSGGFDTLGYTGGPKSTDSYRLSEVENAPPPPTAQEQGIRDFLAGMAMGALIGRGALGADSAEQGLLARQSGERLLNADSSLVELQSSVGIAEAQIQRAELEVRAEKQSLELAKNALISVDPFETAVRFENAETQLQTLYSVTARLSGLSLAKFL